MQVLIDEKQKLLDDIINIRTTQRIIYHTGNLGRDVFDARSKSNELYRLLIKIRDLCYNRYLFGEALIYQKYVNTKNDKTTVFDYIIEGK